MDFNGIVNGGFVIPILAIVGLVLVLAAVIWFARRSAARLARRNREWVEQLPASTGERNPIPQNEDLGGGRRDFGTGSSDRGAGNGTFKSVAR